MIEDSFGQRLKAALNSRHMMQKELAEKIGVNEMAISRYIHGGRIVSVSILIDICKALNVSADYLLGLSEPLPKGHWILKEKGLRVTDYYCSECGRYVRDDTGYDVSKDYPFCHCGADMREVET